MDDDAAIEGTSVMPVQILDRSFQGAELQPEKRLQLAVLTDATMTYAHYAGSTADQECAVVAELDAWFASDAAAGPFSFVAICDSLGFDAGYIRRGLRVPRRQLGRPLGRLSLRRATGSRTHVVGPRARRVA